jgi:hypothetical protein
LGKVARWAQQRRAGDAELPLVAEPPASSLAAWFALTESVASIALAIAEVPGGAAEIKVVAALLGIQNAQNEMLQSINKKVSLLVEGPFRTGELHLREAKRVTSGHADYLEHLRRARDKFYDAHGLAASLQDRAVVELNLGLVYLVLGHRDDAEHWIFESYKSARRIVDELARSSGDIKVLQSKWTTAAAVYAYPVALPILAKKLRKVWNIQRALTALHNLTPFVNSTAACYNGITRSEPVPYLRFEQTGENEFTLQEIQEQPSRGPW